jgi:sec-independent protein translocase protein TatA
MGSFSIWHWLIVLAVVLVLFGGGGKIPRLMKDLGQGITAFRKGLKENKDGDQAQTTADSSNDKHSVIDRS